MHLLLLFLLSSSSFAQSSLRIFENGSYKEIKIVEYQEAHFSSNCLKTGKPHCKAWTAYSGKPAPATKSNTPLAGDPAAQYCWALGAKNRILKSSENKQYDYCVFKDSSMVDAWNIYYKHFPRKK